MLEQKIYIQYLLPMLIAFIQVLEEKYCNCSKSDVFVTILASSQCDETVSGGNSSSLILTVNFSDQLAVKFNKKWTLRK